MLLEPIIVPTHCPCCAHELEYVKDQLFCRNPACDAQLSKKLEHFVKVLGIKGLGPKSLEKLNLGDFSELFVLEHADFAAVLGDKIADKLLVEVDKARNAPLHVILASFSIPLVGETASKKLASVVSHIDDITLEKCKEAGLGDKASANLISWLETEFVEMREFLPFTFKSESNKTNVENAETVCITGKLKSFKTKSEAHSALIAAGYQPVDSVTKTTKYLVDEEGKTSSKRQKAEQYGITIVTNLNSLLQKD